MLNIAWGRFLRWRRFLSLTLLWGIMALPCLAQKVVPGAAPFTLAAALEKTDWNPATQGALLVIAPKEANFPPPSLHITGTSSIVSTIPPPTPQKGRYRLSQWEAYFGRKVMHAGNVTVFAPATMRILNYRNLPKPDAYAGISFAGRLNLLAASLSPAQWRLMGGAEGIGIGDLSGEQRDLFASLVSPNALLVTQTQENSPTQDARFDDVPLTPQQRANFRLRVYRKLDWVFELNQTGATYGMGGEDRAGRVTYHPSDIPSFERRNDIYGVSLAEDVPNRPKPGDLDFTASALNGILSLDGAATIGDVIDRARDVTGVELYADARYRLLPIVVRGASARAGDVLKALCYGVTGTFRRVGPAFVLTDDVAGLGTRMAILAEWVSRNRAAAMERNNRATRRIRESKSEQYIPYPTDAANSPAPALQRKIDEFLKIRYLPLTDAEREAMPGGRALRIPVKELPTAAQERIQRQVAEHDRGTNNETTISEGQRIRRGVVQLSVKSGLQFVFPGVGVVNIADFSGTADLLNPSVMDESLNPTPDAEGPTTVTLAKNKFPVRALIVRPESAEDAQKAAKAAAERGLTELWAEVNLEDAMLLDAVIAAAHENKLKARAVVRVLRPGKETNLPPDITLRGQTASQVAALDLPSLSLESRGFFGGPKWDIEAEMRRQRRMGDWIRPDSPAARETLRSKLVKLAQRPGLDGMVLRDWQPPGYNPLTFDRESPNSPSEQLGYGEEMRLAFLRENSTDPVDINLVNIGALLPFSEGRDHFFVNLSDNVRLPFLPTPESNDGFTPPTKNPDVATRAREADKRWAFFRADQVSAFRKRLTAELKALLPKTPLMILEDMDFPRNFTFPYVASIDPELRAALEAAAQNGEDNTGGTLADFFHRQAKTVYLCLPYYPTKDGTDRKTDFVRQQSETRKRLTGMDGVALDLSSVGVAEALSPLSGIEVKTSEDSAGKAPLK